jgi:hypothetical protein
MRDKAFSSLPLRKKFSDLLNKPSIRLNLFLPRLFWRFNFQRENVFFKLKVQNIATLIITPVKTAASKRITVGSLKVRFCVK